MTDEYEVEAYRYWRGVDKTEQGPPQFAGKCFGVDVQPTDNENGSGSMFSMFIEDDGGWFHQFDASLHWLDDAIAQLQEARDYLNNNHTKAQWGYQRIKND